MRGKKLILATTESGCIIPTSHKLNSDGYFRKKTNGVLEMYHRTVWKEHYGDIPEGYEVHHKDHNKENNDITNLELLSPTQHQDEYAEQNKANGYKLASYVAENFD